MIHTALAVATFAANNNGKSTGSGSALSTFLPLILLVVVFFFLIIRPQRRRQQQMQQVQRTLEPGAQVQTTFGMFATVVAVEDDAIVLEVAPGVHARFLPAVVARVITPVEEPSDPDLAGPEIPDQETPSA